MTDLERALNDFKYAYGAYIAKVEKRYRTLNETDYAQVTAAWNNYVRLRNEYGNHS